MGGAPLSSGNPIAIPTTLFREEFDGWGVVFNPATNEAVAISPMGVAVWKLLDGKHSTAAIIAEIRGRFSQVPDTVVEEITGYVNDLVGRGFAGYAEGAI
jgi:SynChlorMet cassette protein ScmD